LDYKLGEETEPAEEQKGRVVGGDTIFGRLAALRVKLGLTNSEMMKTSWISLCLQSADFPYYNYSAKNVITDPKIAGAILDKYIK